MNLTIPLTLVYIFIISIFSYLLATKIRINKETERFWITNIIAFEIFLLVGLFSILSQTPHNLYLEKLIFFFGIIITGGTLLLFTFKSGSRISTFLFWFLTLFLLYYLIIFAIVFSSI